VLLPQYVRQVCTKQVSFDKWYLKQFQFWQHVQQIDGKLTCIRTTSLSQLSRVGPAQAVVQVRANLLLLLLTVYRVLSCTD